MKLKSSCHHHQPSRNELKVRPEVQQIFGRTSRRLVMCSNTLMNLRYLFNENWKSYVIWTTRPELLKMQHNYNYTCNEKKACCYKKKTKTEKNPKTPSWWSQISKHHRCFVFLCLNLIYMYLRIINKSRFWNQSQFAISEKYAAFLL